MTVSSSSNKVQYNGNGSTTVFAYTFKVFNQNDLTVIIRSASGTETVKTITTHYTVSGVGSAGGGNVTMLTAPAAGETITILREQDLIQEFDLVPNDPFPAQLMEDALDKLTFMVQQHSEELDRAIKASRTNTIGSTEFAISAANRANKIFAFDSAGELAVTQELGTYRGNWATSTAFAQRDIIKDTSTSNIYICVTAHTSTGSQPISGNADAAKWALLVDAAAAATSASNAATSETNAAVSASAAAASQSNAASSASAASTSASNASTSASTASAAADAALAALDSFDDRYLGQKASNPSVDNDGNALIAGALYFDTTNDIMKVYDGSVWVAAYASLSGALLASNNLSDLTDPALALTNLGKASQAQAEAGTDNATLMTPLRTAQAIDALTPPSGTQQFVASGTIPNGALVGLNANGTISVVTASKSGTITSTNSSGPANASAYDPSTGKIVLVYGNNLSGQVVVGTVSGGNITFGTTVNFTFEYELTGLSLTLDQTSGHFILSYGTVRYVSSTTKYAYTYARAISVSGTTPTVNASTTLVASGNTGATYVWTSISQTPITGTAYTAIVSATTSYTYPFVAMVSVSGTSVVLQSLTSFVSEFVQQAYYGQYKTTSIAYRASDNKLLIHYQSASAGTTKYVVGTVSGTSITFGAAANVTGNASSYNSVVYNPHSGQFISTEFSQGGVSSVLAGTLSGTTYSLTATCDVTSFGVAAGCPVACLSATDYVFVGTTGTAVYTARLKLSGSAFYVVNSTGTSDINASQSAPSIDLYNSGFILSTNGNKSTFFYPMSTFSSWVGIAAENIASGQSGAVTVVTGVNTAQSGLISGLKYGVSEVTGGLVAGTTTNVIGLATSPTSLYLNTGRL